MAEILVRQRLAAKQKRSNAKQKTDSETEMAKPKTLDKQTEQLINR